MGANPPKVRTKFTPEEIEKIDHEIDEWLYEFSRSDLDGLIQMLKDKMTLREQVLNLSDDPYIVAEILGFNPFVDRTYDPEVNHAD